jgi:hypothetical protein
MGLFFTIWIVNPMLNFLKRTMTYPGFEPGTLGLQVGIANRVEFVDFRLVEIDYVV